MMNFQRAVVIAGGAVNNIDFIKENTNESDFIVAVDRGYDYCVKASVVPNLIVGDFDSVSKPPVTDIKTIKLKPEKDITDLQCALDYLRDKFYTDVLVLGGLGNRIDHTFANINLLEHYILDRMEVKLKDENHLIYIVHSSTAVIKNKNAYISVFPVGECIISEKGFKYPLDHHKLSCFDVLGISNELTQNNGMITIHDGMALIMEVNKNL